MAAIMDLSASMEDYLEAIYHLVVDKQAARARDIAKRLKVNRSSVTGALRMLAEKGLINYAPYEVITLTRKGTMAAREVVRKHEALRDFLVKILSVDGVRADEAACLMEHAVPPEILDRLVKFVQFVEMCPRGGARWIKGFGYHCENNDAEDCERCISACLSDVKNKSQRESEEGKVVVSLRELEPGQRGKVEQIAGRGEVYKRLIDMGLTPGSMVEMRRVAPLGDPIEIKVRGYNLSLRKQEAEKIWIQLVGGAAERQDP